MTIQIPNVGTGVPADQTGDSPWLAMKKVGDNFSDQSNAASRLVGFGLSQIADVKNLHKAMYGQSATFGLSENTDLNNMMAGDRYLLEVGVGTNKPSNAALLISTEATYIETHLLQIAIGYATLEGYFRVFTGAWSSWAKILHSGNTRVDSNGFLKAASPIAEIYSDKMNLNDDATEQGGITFEKLGVGDYLVKGSLGFSQEGWYIETPKDANGNVLVAVVYEQLANNDISIKTYAKRFDDETGDIVANLAKPRDIPVGRFISLRLHELPKAPPVIPTEV